MYHNIAFLLESLLFLVQRFTYCILYIFPFMKSNPSFSISHSILHLYFFSYDDTSIMKEHQIGQRLESIPYNALIQ